MTDYIFRTAEGPRFGSLLSPWSMLANLWSRRELTLQFARRDFAAKYRASYLGLLWSIVSPLLLLAVYTFIFSAVFEMRWGRNPSGGPGAFAVTMFIGMLIFNLFAEVVNRSPTLVVSRPNFVKKVVFPLEVFVPSILISSLATMVIGLAVWLVGRVILMGWPTWTALLMPVVLLPICLFTLGCGWFLASLGTFVRDIGHTVSVIVQVLFLATPIFYGLERVPLPYRSLLRLSPLTQAVESARRVMLWDSMPDWSSWGAWLFGSALVALAGYAFFIKSRRAFGDVI